MRRGESASATLGALVALTLISACEPAHTSLPVAVEVGASGGLRIAVPACEGDLVRVLGVVSDKPAVAPSVLVEPWKEAPADTVLTFDIDEAALRSGHIADYELREFSAVDSPSSDLADYGRFVASLAWGYTTFNLADAASLDPGMYVFDGADAEGTPVPADVAASVVADFCETSRGA